MHHEPSASTTTHLHEPLQHPHVPTEHRNALHEFARNVSWASCAPPPRNTSEAYDLLDRLHLDWRTFDFEFDYVTGKKKGPNQRSANKDKTRTGVYLRCTRETVQAIDIDRSSPQASELLRLLEGRCNFVAQTKKGIHLLFANDGSLPQGMQAECGIDIRSQNGSSQPDILFCAPARYNAYGSLIQYEWIVVPQSAPLPCPTEVVEFIRTLPRMKKQAKQPTTSLDPSMQHAVSCLGQASVIHNSQGIPTDAQRTLARSMLEGQTGTYTFHYNSGRDFQHKTVKFTVEHMPNADRAVLRTDDGHRYYLPPPSSNIAVTSIALEDAKDARQALLENICRKHSIPTAGVAGTKKRENGQEPQHYTAPRQCTALQLPHDIRIFHSPCTDSFPITSDAATKQKDSGFARDRAMDYFDHIIFFDGGCTRNPGAGGAGITIFHKSDGWSSHLERWIFSSSTTNNRMEFSSIGAGLKSALNNPGNVLLIGDSELTISILLDFKNTTDPYLTPLNAENRQLFQRIQDRVTVGHTAGHSTHKCYSDQPKGGNPADNPTNLARYFEEDLDPDKLFTVPALPMKKASRKAKTTHSRARDTTTPVELLSQEVPKSTEEFLNLVKKGARRTIPPFIWEMWSRTVKQYTMFAATCPREDFDRAITLLLLAPTRHLPRFARLRTIDHALTLGRLPLHNATTDSAGSVPANDNLKRIRRCERLAKDGFIKQAVRSLNPVRIADTADPFVLQQLQEKHPKRTQDIPPLPPLPLTFPHDQKHIIEKIEKAGNGVAPGFSGWSKELIRPAVKFDESIAADLAVIEAKIMDEWLSDSARELMTLGKLIALLKDSGANVLDSSPDVRPIVVGEFLDNLFGSLALDCTDKVIPRWQRGMDAKSGARLSYEDAQKWFMEGSTLLTLDNSNAFNSVYRKAIAERLVHNLATHERLTKYFRFRYLKPTTLITIGSDGIPRKILSEEGTSQGNTVAGYLYNLAQDPVLDRVASRQDKAGYMDDATLKFDDPGEALDLFPIIEAALRDIGLSLNRKKCELITHITPEISERASTLGIKLLDRNDPKVIAKILGAPVARAEAQSQWCTYRLARTKDMCELLKDHNFDARLALSLLRHVHLARAVYIAQCVPPEITSEAMRMFDDLTSSTFKTIFGDDIEDYFIEHHCGAGLTSMARCAPEIYRRAHSGAKPTCTINQFAAAQMGLPHDELRVAQALSATGYKAHTWMHFTPEVHFPSHLFVEAMRIRCNAPLDVEFCSCGENVQSHHHMMHCSHTHGYTWLHRHNECMACLAGVARRYGVTVMLEPTCYSDEDLRRPDGIFCLGPRSITNDLIITDPCAPSNISRATQHPGATAKKAAEEKCTKHAANVESLGHKFFATAFETYGHADSSVNAFLQTLATAVHKSLRKEFLREAWASLTSSIQAGNAKILDSALRAARAACIR